MSVQLCTPDLTAEHCGFHTCQLLSEAGPHGPTSTRSANRPGCAKQDRSGVGSSRVSSAHSRRVRPPLDARGSGEDLVVRRRGVRSCHLQVTQDFRNRCGKSVGIGRCLPGRHAPFRMFQRFALQRGTRAAVTQHRRHHRPVCPPQRTPTTSADVLSNDTDDRRT
jgi:hypothetical protein